MSVVLAMKSSGRGTGAKYFIRGKVAGSPALHLRFRPQCSAGVNSPPIWGDILVMTTHVSLELGGMGPAKKKPQSASAGWGKVIGPYLQAPAPGDSRCSRPQFRPHNFCESMTARQHFP
jgi:hypothetical protein